MCEHGLVVAKNLSFVDQPSLYERLRYISLASWWSFKKIIYLLLSFDCELKKVEISRKLSVSSSNFNGDAIGSSSYAYAAADIFEKSILVLMYFVLLQLKGKLVNSPWKDDEFSMIE